MDGQEIARAAENKVAKHDLRVARESSSASSSSPAVAPAGPAQLELIEEGGEDAEQRRARGPHLAPRQRGVWRDQGDNPERPHDWTHFDIGRAVRLFRTHREGAIRIALRKLHVRWWHASEHVMKRFLDRVGVADRVLQFIPEVVQTCKICREWAKSGPDNV